MLSDRQLRAALEQAMSRPKAELVEVILQLAEHIEKEQALNAAYDALVAELKGEREALERRVEQLERELARVRSDKKPARPPQRPRGRR